MLRLGLGLGLFCFILNSHPLTRDLSCPRRYLDGKNMSRKCQMNNLFSKRRLGRDPDTLERGRSVILFQVYFETQERYRYHLEGIWVKEGVINSYINGKSTCIVDPKLGLKGYINEVLFSLKSNEESNLKVYV